MVLNNQAVTSLLVVLLVLLILFMFTKVSYLFEPIWQFLAIVGLPIILAGILYYLMNPAVDYLERKESNASIVFSVFYFGHRIDRLGRCGDCAEDPRTVHEFR